MEVLAFRLVSAQNIKDQKEKKKSHKSVVKLNVTAALSVLHPYYANDTIALVSEKGK